MSVLLGAVARQARRFSIPASQSFSGPLGTRTTLWRSLSVGQALTSASEEQLTVLRVALDGAEVELRVELTQEELVRSRQLHMTKFNKRCCVFTHTTGMSKKNE